ncbi:hypothetical protein PRIPAC_81539, partial [Pristionchus pacificus]
SLERLSMSSNSSNVHHVDKKITQIFWITVCAITWVILILMCISNLWTHFRRVFCRNNQPEYHVHVGDYPHMVHSTEQVTPSEIVPPPMEKTCISAPRSKTRSKSNKPLLPKETKAKSQPKSDQLENIPVMTPQEKSDETIDTQTGPIKIPGMKR